MIYFYLVMLQGGDGINFIKIEAEQRVTVLPDRLVFWTCVSESHLLQFATPVQLIMAHVSLFSQVFHIGTNQHLTELHKITVILTVH